MTELHVPNLKTRLAENLKNAIEQCEWEHASGQDSFFTAEYRWQARDFAAGLEVVDNLVDGDRFQSIHSLKLCRHAMQRYRTLLENCGCPLSALRVGLFIQEMNAAFDAWLEAQAGPPTISKPPLKV